MRPDWIEYEFYGITKDLDDKEKKELIDVFCKIQFELNVLMNRENMVENFDDKKYSFQEKVKNIILDKPEILFIIQKNAKDNSKTTIYEEVLKYDLIYATAACLATDCYRDTLSPYGEYPIIKLIENHNKQLFPEVMHIYENIYTQVDDKGRNLAMHLAKKEYEDYKKYLFMFLEHEEASIAQDNEGRTIGMYCAMEENRDGVIRACKHPMAKKLCDKNGYNIFDYAKKYGIEIPRLTNDELMDKEKEKISKRLR